MDLFGKNSFLIPLAIGMTFVILTGGIDLSVGAVMALGSVIAATLLQQGWLGPIVIILVVLLVGSLMGLVVGLIIDRFNIQPFIATLAAMFLARGLCLVITDRSIAINDPFFKKVNLGQSTLWETTTYQPARRDHGSPTSTPPRRCSSRWSCWCSRSWCCITPGSGARSTPSAGVSRRPG